jgi:uncharacterized membrane protein
VGAVRSQESSKRRRSRIGFTVRGLLRTRITTGIITLLPLLVTLWVIKLIFGWMRDASQWVIQAFLLSHSGRPYLEYLQFDFERWGRLTALGLPNPQEQFFQLMPAPVRWGIALLSVLLTIFVCYLVGLLAANVFGRRLIVWLEQLMTRVPLVKTVYHAVKQILSSFAGDQTQNFQRVALVPFPQDRMRSVGFVTNVFKDSVTGEELCSVFIATTPNPTTGYLQIVRRSEITELDWSVEEAIRTVMSGGILKPDFLTIVPNEALRTAIASRGRSDGPAKPPDNAGAEP